jgi:hypothetical protein
MGGLLLQAFMRPPRKMGMYVISQERKMGECWKGLLGWYVTRRAGRHCSKNKSIALWGNMTPIIRYKL